MRCWTSGVFIVFTTEGPDVDGTSIAIGLPKTGIHLVGILATVQSAPVRVWVACGALGTYMDKPDHEHSDIIVLIFTLGVIIVFAPSQGTSHPFIVLAAG